MNILFYISVILLAGMVTAWVLKRFKFPHVTGYLIGGVLIGPAVLGIVPADTLISLELISDVALGFIAFLIGNEFKVRQLKREGKSIVIITFFEAMTAVGLVFAVMYFAFNQSIPFSLMIASIAAATAPAATLMVIRQYHARGNLVHTLLPVVALDDVFSIITFGIATSISKAVIKNATPNIMNMLVFPIAEILASILLGLLAGFLVLFVLRKIRSEANYLNVLIAGVFLCIAVSIKFHLSPLLSCMTFGATIANLLPNPQKPVAILDHITAPIYLSFFTISGASLNITALTHVGLIGISYFLVRFIGKWLGAFVSCKMMKKPAEVSKYLGIALMPQAGVALGLSLTAERIIGAPYGAQIRTVILATTVVYELLGPMMSKFALKQAGEIKDTKS
ncbi:MAG: cation/H(+) antiporter [Treponema sp.]|nr:MAG: cation/H(+) antiporter [Treponema sp.]